MLWGAKVAELVDAQDSGSCERKLVGVQVPPFALILIILSFIFTTGCQNKLERLQEKSLKHLEAAAEILQKNAGNTKAAVAALKQYIQEHKDDIDNARIKGRALLMQLPKDKRIAFIKKATQRSQRVREKINNLLKTFDHPEQIIILLHRLM